jgi:hypothetical protein
MNFVKKNSLKQFIPKQFEYVSKCDIILYKDLKLKSDYLINIMHDLIMKYFFIGETTYNLSSLILKKKYGKFYNYYIDYLIENKFMFLVSNYYSGTKSRTYRLNITTLDLMNVNIHDKILLKKFTQDYLYDDALTEKSSINMKIRKRLIDDLNSVEIDYNSAVTWLNSQKKNIETAKFFKNSIAIENIHTDNLFFKFDRYGRLHSNFTILKRHIRQNYLTIDDSNLCEIDIKNSQPFFFAVFLKRTMNENDFNDETKRFIDSVNNGVFYDEFVNKYPKVIHSRIEAKMMIYKVFFGDNKDYKKECKLFKGLYPTIYQYIKDFKDNNGSYKSLSYELQKIESNFIFNSVITEIYNKYPEIKLFTVHDSIVFQEQYKEEVTIIFNSHLKKLK